MGSGRQPAKECCVYTETYKTLKNKDFEAAEEQFITSTKIALDKFGDPHD